MLTKRISMQLTRREFVRTSCAAALLTVVRIDPLHATVDDVVVVEYSDAGVRLGPRRVARVAKSEAEWRRELSPLAFTVTRHADTERPFTGAYWNLHDRGLFRCICCGNAVFASNAKFDAGTGWPSFWQPIAPENVVGPAAQTPGADPTEVTCRQCSAHLGDIYDDGPKPTGLRYCIDSIALRFVKFA